MMHGLTMGEQSTASTHHTRPGLTTLECGRGLGLHLMDKANKSEASIQTNVSDYIF